MAINLYFLMTSQVLRARIIGNVTPYVQTSVSVSFVLYCFYYFESKSSIKTLNIFDT